jgi:hypothetical protein
MKKSACVLGLWVVVALAGCGGGAPPVNKDRASEVLKVAFDAWKNGDDYDSLAKRTPPLHFNEPAWKAGSKLVDFRIGAVDMLGRQAKCPVKLTLQDKAGKTIEREIGYLVDTTPNIVIVREGLGM